MARGDRGAGCQGRRAVDATVLDEATHGAVLHRWRAVARVAVRVLWEIVELEGARWCARIFILEVGSLAELVLVVLGEFAQASKLWAGRGESLSPLLVGAILLWAVTEQMAYRLAI